MNNIVIKIYTKQKLIQYTLFKYIRSYNLWYRTQLWRSDESSSFFYIKTEPRFSSSSQPFCSRVIFHIPIKSESCAEQDGVYRFWIGPWMAEIWLFICVMTTRKSFPSHLKVLLAGATSSEELKNYTNLTTILQWVTLS